MTSKVLYSGKKIYRIEQPYDWVTTIHFYSDSMSIWQGNGKLERFVQIDKEILDEIKRRFELDD